MNRFTEPKDWDDNVLRIYGTYEPDAPIVLVPENRCEHFRDLDDFNNAAYWPKYEVEQLKGSEPDVIKARLYFFEGGQRVEVVNAHGLEVLAEDYLREDHGRWAAMREWLQEYGEVELVREAA